MQKHTTHLHLPNGLTYISPTGREVSTVNSPTLFHAGSTGIGIPHACHRRPCIDAFRLFVAAAEPSPSQLGDAAESIGARAVRNRKSAEESKVAARREAGAIDAAARLESRLAAEAVAAKAELEAAAAAAQEEKAKRDRVEAARAAAEAVERARLADQAAGAAAEAAIKAAMAARQATAEAAAAAETGKDPETIGEIAPEHGALEPMSSSSTVDAEGDGDHAPEGPMEGEAGVETLASSGPAVVPEPR